MARSLRNDQATTSKITPFRVVSERASATERGQLLEAGLVVLDALSYERTGLLRSDICAILNLDDAIASEVIAVLEKHGLLSYDARRDVYIAGVRSLGLGHSYSTETPLIRAANPTLARIRDQSNETTILTVRWGEYRVNIAQASGHHLFNRAPPPIKPLHLGSGGKILLSGMSDIELAGYVQRLKAGHAAHIGDSDFDAMIESLREIRKTGVAEGFSERSRESASFATAVRDDAGGILGALVVSVPLHRYQDGLRHRVLQLLINGAEEISDEYLRNGSFEH